MIERHDFQDDKVWSDGKLVEYHNEMVDIVNNDPMPRLGEQALRQMHISRFEIDQRTIDIVEEDPDEGPN